MWKTARSHDHEGGSIPHTVWHPPGYPRYTAGRCRTIKQAVQHTAAARLHHSSHLGHIPDAAHPVVYRTAAEKADGNLKAVQSALVLKAGAVPVQKAGS